MSTQTTCQACIVLLTPVGYKGITSVKRNDSSTREPRDMKDDTSPCHAL